MTIVGKLSNAVNDLDWKANDKEKEFNKYARKERKQREDIGETIVLDKMQQMGKRKIDDSFISTRKEY